MSKWLVDTNVLVAIDNPQSPFRHAATSSVTTLRSRGAELCVCAQLCSEYWSIVTRPQQRGVPLLPKDAHASIVDFRKSLYIWLPDPTNLFEEWLRLCLAHGITGAKCYDTRLLALLSLGGVDHILTFNSSDFSGYTNVTAVNPSSV